MRKLKQEKKITRPKDIVSLDPKKFSIVRLLQDEKELKKEDCNKFPLEPYEKVLKSKKLLFSTEISDTDCPKTKKRKIIIEVTCERTLEVSGKLVICNSPEVRVDHKIFWRCRITGITNKGCVE